MGYIGTTILRQKVSLDWSYAVLQNGGKPNTLATLCLKVQDTDKIYWMMKEEANSKSKAPSGKDAKSSHFNSNSNSNNSSTPKPNNSLRLENLSTSDAKPKNTKESSLRTPPKWARMGSSLLKNKNIV